MKKINLVLLLSIILAASCQKLSDKMSTSNAPIAAKKPHKLEKHGDLRVDDYYWLNDREDEEVLAYLRAENAYYADQTAHTADFQQQLFEEMKSRIKEDDSSVPYRLKGYWYSTNYEKGKEYPIYSRKKDEAGAVSELLFNCNELAAGHEYYNLRGISISPDNSLACFGVDTVSRRLYSLQIKNLESGELYPEIIENTTGQGIWASDGKTLFYTRKDLETLRPHKIFKHILGTDPAEDELVYEETDETFNTFVYKTKSRDYLVIGSQSTLTSEYRILKADSPDGEFAVFSPRERGLEYSIAHYNGDFFILTNRDGATNFKLMRALEDKTSQENWQEFVPHREDVLLEDIEIFKDYYVLSERENGLSTIRVIRWDGSEEYYLPFDNETYVAQTHVNPEFDSETLRYVYSAMTSPYSVIDFNLRTREQQVMKVQEVLGGDFNPENYRSERLWATARDGARIPISLVYHKDTPLDGSSPLFQYGYGSYGSTTDPYFSVLRLSLLDRGFIYAIAHVRGGEYLGRHWYEEGRLMAKKNTFTDFIDCSKHLISAGYTSASHLYAYGASAGGLLVGAVINMEPDLYNGVIAAVPFVDVVTTMLDESIPLTTGEYDEWGDPNQEDFYHYMKSYSPYDNVSGQHYPNLLVTTGLHDSQVQYWEPAKWVAKLRATKSGDNQLYLDTNMDTGHGGASGRFEALRETAKEYAFLLDLEGKTP